jgi:hypothetical protein
MISNDSAVTGARIAPSLPGVVHPTFAHLSARTSPGRKPASAEIANATLKGEGSPR